MPSPPPLPARLGPLEFGKFGHFAIGGGHDEMNGRVQPWRLPGHGLRRHAAAMFVVTEAEAAAIRAVFEQQGELSAAIELRRLFPGVTDNAQARACARTIAGGKTATPRRGRLGCPARGHSGQSPVADALGPCPARAHRSGRIREHILPRRRHCGRLGSRRSLMEHRFIGASGPLTKAKGEGANRATKRLHDAERHV
jgi:hypothetical protein